MYVVVVGGGQVGGNLTKLLLAEGIILPVNHRDFVLVLCQPGSQDRTDPAAT